MSVCGYLKAVLLNSSGRKAVGIANAIATIMADPYNDSLPLFLSAMCLACADIATG
jgi:hypothetical protein